MTDDAAPRCLDITRLISRSGRTLTGVDRVELAYLRELLRRGDPVWFLARTSAGFSILGRDGGQAMLDRIEGRVPYGRADLIALLSRKLTPERRRAEADLRRLAIAGGLRAGLASRLRQVMPRGTRYLNVGHSNLTDRTLTAWRAVPEARIDVLIHDTIPLDHPQFQRPESVARFRGVLGRVCRHADRIIANSGATASDVTRWSADFGRCPPIVTAPLGVDPVEASVLPPDIPTDRPYFVILGTIEPRKNHALLLDVWDELRADMDRPPRLVVAGSRGWRNEEVFARLDAERGRDDLILERPGLSDRQVTALLQGSAGLLFPSHAEGFGLPAVEAARLGVRVLATKLPVFREILSDYCVYADPDDVYFWKQRIMSWATNMQVDRAAGEAAAILDRLTWQTHFELALSP
ncbi:glycosyltransferase family 4 protein [Anianabacter salinae]|uniref:glycosyltransferase family 4 protein n=1 Tax=Anianabacter salinae TaxID=2851023 RepID=UPI00225E2314|nr:glycosyltransferase [Anianabacter salinae]MBV0913577.1 glycosyltransferase [Anianabacter salinae]